MKKILYILTISLLLFFLSIANEEGEILPFIEEAQVQNIEEENIKNRDWINSIKNIKDRFVPLTITVMFSIPVAFAFAIFKEAVKRKASLIKEIDEVNRKVKELESQQENLEEQLKNLSVYEIPEEVEKIISELSVAEKEYEELYETMEDIYIDVDMFL